MTVIHCGGDPDIKGTLFNGAKIQPTSLCSGSQANQAVLLAVAFFLVIVQSFL